MDSSKKEDIDEMEVLDTRAPWWDMIETLAVEDVLSVRDPVSVRSDDKLPVLFQALRANKILGTVVTEKDGTVRGFVDVYDILSYFILIASQGKEEAALDQVGEVVKNYPQVADSFRVGNLVNLSGSNQLLAVNEREKLKEVMKLFEKEVHRVAVLSDEGNLVGVISQSDVIRLFAQRGVAGGRLIDQPLEKLDLGVGEVFSVRETDYLFVALQKMRANRLSAAAVVDHRGLLVANLSVSDLKGIDPQTLDGLTLTVKEFLFRTYGFPKAPIVVKPWETVEHVLLKLSFHGVHRVWVVSPTQTPIGVVSHTDLIRFFLTH
jgi:CBS domain-containing protein